MDPIEVDKIEKIIRSEKLEYIIYLGDLASIGNIAILAKIYGIPLTYPRVARHMPLSSGIESWIG
jgi:hypothetical protein